MAETKCLVDTRNTCWEAARRPLPLASLFHRSSGFIVAATSHGVCVLADPIIAGSHSLCLDPVRQLPGFRKDMRQLLMRLPRCGGGGRVF